MRHFFFIDKNRNGGKHRGLHLPPKKQKNRLKKTMYNIHKLEIAGRVKGSHRKEAVKH